MKSAFPAWLKRIDPVLEAEATNGVYQAFRERRLRGGWILVWPEARSMILWLGIVIIVILVLQLTQKYIPSGARPPLNVVAIFIGFLRILHQGKRRPSRVKARTIPRHVSSVFKQEAWIEQPAVDLWMTGATGRDIAEAMYLERREHWMQGMLVTVFMVSVIAGIGMFLFRAYLNAIDIVVLLMFSLALGVLIALAALHQPAFGICSAIRGDLRVSILRQPCLRTVPDPRAPEAPGKDKTREIRQAVVVVLFCLIACALYYILMRPRGAMLFLLVLCVPVALIARLFMIGYNPEQNVLHCRICFAEADAAFTYLMCTLIQDDPDAVRWAWLYRGIEAYPAPRTPTTLDRAFNWMAPRGPH